MGRLGRLYHHNLSAVCLVRIGDSELEDFFTICKAVMFLICIYSRCWSVFDEYDSFNSNYNFFFRKLGIFWFELWVVAGRQRSFSWLEIPGTERSSQKV